MSVASRSRLSQIEALERRWCRRFAALEAKLDQHIAALDHATAAPVPRTIEPKRAAAILGVSEARVRQIAAKAGGELGDKVGREWRLDRRKIEALAARRA